MIGISLFGARPWGLTGGSIGCCWVEKKCGGGAKLIILEYWTSLHESGVTPRMMKEYRHRERSVAIHGFGSHGLRHFVRNDDVLSR